MTHIARKTAHVRTEQWVRPGAEQTLEELIEKFKDRVIRVDVERGEILVGESEQEICLPTSDP